MNVPHKFKDHFLPIKIKNSDYTLLSGFITCCSESSFEVLYYGELRNGFIFRKELHSYKNGLAIILKCKKCGKIINLFDSETDGYDNCVLEKSPVQSREFKQLFCGKNRHSSFTVKIKLEYPPKEDLLENNTSFSGDEFSWIWISLKCNLCKKSFSHFVSLETM